MVISKELKVLNYYKICNKLKDTIRTGWKKWNVQRARIESVADHIYGTQMLALAMYSEFHYDIDISKVLYMLAIHELGEALIGDITKFDITKEDKWSIEHRAVHGILSPLAEGIEIEALFVEFDEHQTPEGWFAYQCDKAECCLQSKFYDNEHCVNLRNQDGNPIMEDELVSSLLRAGKSWSEMWIEYWCANCQFDEHFMSVLKYAETSERF